MAPSCTAYRRDPEKPGLLGAEMTPEKRRKIKALMESPASTENEKEICRKLLKDNPEDPGQPVTARSRRDFWQKWQETVQHDAARRQAQAVNDGVNWYRNATDSARRQQQAAQGQADPGHRFYAGSGPDLSDHLRQARRDVWNSMKEQVEAGNLKFDSGPLKDFYKHLNKLRKERGK